MSFGSNIHRTFAYELCMNHEHTTIPYPSYTGIKFATDKSLYKFIIKDTPTLNSTNIPVVIIELPFSTPFIGKFSEPMIKRQSIVSRVPGLMMKSECITEIYELAFGKV